MDGIYNELAGHAEMQMDLIRDCEPVPPIGDIDFFEEMAINCDKWPRAIARQMAIECKYYAIEFANENSYHVVTLTEGKAYTQVDLYETIKDEDDGAFLKHKLTACAPKGNDDKHDTSLSLILFSYQSAYGKLIVL